MMQINMAPKLAMHNKSRLEKVNECVCYGCLRVYNPVEIVEWTDKELDTAVCPHCLIDAVLPVYEENEKDKTFLAKLHEYWF
jgi:hypothetical protein